MEEYMEYKVVEVNSGLFTGTLRGNAIQAVINQYAADGWKFEDWHDIIGRCCCQEYYKLIVCFSRESDDDETVETSDENSYEDITINGKNFVKNIESDEICCPECKTPIEDPESIKFCGSCGHKYE